MYQPEKNQMEVFAENLLDVLAKKKLSQNQLAKKIGVSAMSVNKWARGLAMPRNDKIDQMCQVLNIQRSDLLADKSTIPNLSIPAALIGGERDLNPFYLCTPMYCGELRCTFFIVFDEVPTKRSYKKWHHNGHHLLS